MPVEEDINEAIQELTFNKNLPEFKAMAKHLEEKLEPGENLLSGVDKYANDKTEFVYLEIHRTEGTERTQKVAIIDCLGKITYRTDIFEDYITRKAENKEWRSLILF